MKAHELARILLDCPDIEVVDDNEASIVNVNVFQVADESSTYYREPRYVYPYDQSEYCKWWANCPKTTVIKLS